MRNLLFLVIVSFLLSCPRQGASESSLIKGGGSPAGSCISDSVYMDTSGGDVFICNGRDWKIIGSGSTIYVNKIAGANFGVKVNSCISAINLMGGGTCDATGFGDPQTSSVNIVVGDGTHSVTLLMPAVKVTLASGKQIIFRSFSNFKGAGRGVGSNLGFDGLNGTTIVSDTSTTPVINYNESGSTTEALVNASLSDFTIWGTGPVIPGSVGLQIGGNSSDVQSSYFANILVRGFDTGVQLDGPTGCTCYNTFINVSGLGDSIGVKIKNSSGFASGVNKNDWFGGRFWGHIGLYESGSNGNVYTHPGFENCSTHSVEFYGSKAIISAYSEASSPPYFGDSSGYNMIFGSMENSSGALLIPEYGTGPTTQYGGPKSNMIFGPNATPLSIGIQNEILMGSVGGTGNQFDDLYHSRAKLDLTHLPQYVALIGSGINAGEKIGLRSGYLQSQGKVKLGSVAFLGLSDGVVGDAIYCTDCDTPAAPGSTCSSSGDKVGAEAHYIRGAWGCF